LKYLTISDKSSNYDISETINNFEETFLEYLEIDIWCLERVKKIFKLWKKVLDEKKGIEVFDYYLEYMEPTVEVFLAARHLAVERMKEKRM